MRQRSPGSWGLRVYAGLDPDTRRRTYRTATIRGDRARAERQLADMVESVQRSAGIGARCTVGELLEAWYSIASLGWSPATVRQTRSVIDCHLIRHLTDVRVGELSTVDIDHLYRRLRTGGGRDGGPLKAGTVQRVHVVLRSALAQAVRWGWIWDNPAERTHRIVVDHTEPYPPTAADVSTLLDHLAAVDPVFHVFVVLAATTGARRAQLLGLRWRDIDTDRGRIAFCHGLVEGLAGPVLTSTKTRRRHSVEIDDRTRAVLAEHRRRAEVTGVGDGGDPVFASEGRVWLPNWVTKQFQRHLAAAGLRPFRLHDLRHFMATEMLCDGVAVPLVSRRLDHQRVSTTLDFYCHTTPAGDRHAANTIRAVIDAG